MDFSPWGCKGADTTERLKDNCALQGVCSQSRFPSRDEGTALRVTPAPGAGPGRACPQTLTWVVDHLSTTGRATHGSTLHRSCSSLGSLLEMGDFLSRQ